MVQKAAGYKVDNFRMVFKAGSGERPKEDL
jgi:hypothetical protein